MEVYAQAVYMQPDDVLVCYYDFNEFNISEIEEMHKSVCRQYQGYKVIGLPNTSSIDVLTKEDAISMLKSLINYIEDS